MSTTTTPELVHIEVPYPEAPQLTLRLRLGPCRVRVHPGDGPTWISGTYQDPSLTLPIDVRTERDGATIAQRFDPSRLVAAALPVLELAIARARPFALAIETGASENVIDLGGLPLTSLDVKAGAGKYEIDFSAPNPTEMTSLELSAGAGALHARHLANANFAQLHLGGGVSGCLLDFSGELRRDATARIDAALGSIDVLVPATTAMRLAAKAIAASKRASGAIERKGDEFYTRPALEGKRPLLTVDATMAFGALAITAV